MLPVSEESRSWAADQAGYFFDEVLPEILRASGERLESLDVIFVVSSASFSPLAPKATHEEYLRKRQWNEADQERLFRWTSEGALFEIAILFMLDRAMPVETVLEFLEANQRWGAVAVVRGREALEAELAKRYSGPGSYCDLFDHLSDRRLVINAKASVHKPEKTL